MPPSDELLLPTVESTDTSTHYVTLALDAVAALAVAAGVGWGLWPYLGPFAVAIGGVLLGLIVYLAEVIREPHPDLPEPASPPEPPRVPPGPRDPGPLHVSGG
jgi:hypothetical protein